MQRPIKLPSRRWGAERFAAVAVEAMLVGRPIVGLATTELVTVIRNGENGFIDTDLGVPVDRMNELLADPDPGLARRLGEAARAIAAERFAIGRFVADCERAQVEVAN